MKIGIIGAMAQEVEILANLMQERTTTKIANCIIYNGKIANHEVSLIQSGVGKVSASIGTTLLLDHFKPDIVINTGSAGGVAPDLCMGDVVVSTACLYHDVDVTAFGYAKGQLPACPPYFTADEQLVQQLTTIAQNQGLKVRFGLIASGDHFVQGGDALAKIKQDFPEVLAVEMECASIAQVCHQWNVPWVVVRAISDNGDGEANLSFEEFLPLASQKSSLMIMEFLENLAV